MSEIKKGHLVSVIIPVYNGVSFISDTIKSVLNQTYKNTELIIVDDGSTDNLKETIKCFLEKDNLRFYQKKNSGVSASRNFGFKRAYGDFVIFLDADDLLAKKFIENKLNYIGSKDFIGSKIIHFKEDIQNEIGYKVSVTEKLVENILNYKEGFSTCPSAYMFSSSFLKFNSIFFRNNLSSIADKDFLLSVAKSSGKGALDNNISSCLFYRIHENNMSRKLNSKLIFDNAKFYQLLENYSWIDDILLKKSMLKGYKILFKSFAKVGKICISMKYIKKYLFLKLNI